MNETELYAVLDRATDAVEPIEGPQHAALSALARARVVRTRRRGLVAGAVAAVAVLAVWVAVGIHGTDRAEPPIAPSPPARGIADADVQPTFDPRAASSLPPASSVLPTRLQPSAAGGLPSTGPVRLALAAGEDRFDLLVEDGSWVTTRSPAGETYTSGLSDDGTMLAAVGPQGLWVVDVQEGTWRQLAPPDATLSLWTGLGTHVSWQDDVHVVLDNTGGILIVPTDEGAPRERLSFDQLRFDQRAYAALGAGRAVLSGVDDSGPAVVEVADDEATRLVPAAELGTWSLPVANGERVAATSPGIVRDDRPTQHSGILVLDRGTYDAAAYLPIARTRYEPGVGVTSAGGVRPWGWVDANTVLLGDEPNRGKDWTLTAWDVESGDLSLVATGDAEAYLVAVAADLVQE